MKNEIYPNDESEFSFVTFDVVYGWDVESVDDV